MSSKEVMSEMDNQTEKINFKEIWFKALSNWKLMLGIFVLVLSSG